MKEKAQIVRVEAHFEEGLTDNQVALRVQGGWTNHLNKTVGKSYVSIFLGNILTFFNFLGLFIFIVMAAIGSWENMVFCVVILANTCIGIFQEIRSKRTVEKLSLMTAPVAKVVRNGKQSEIAVGNVVIDDILVFENGNQICCDCKVVAGEVEVNEAMLTGESDNVKKKKGDTLYSGSFVVAGTCHAQSVAVGYDNYVEVLQAKVKKYKKPASELMNSINGIIKLIALIIFPLGFATFAKSFWGNHLSITQSIKVAAGSMIGMVPSGMVLLTSVALAISIIKLAQKKCLVQDMYCIEMLARVDTLCLDKTGTITDGTMTVEHVEALNDTVDLNLCIPALLNATKDDNMTAKALKAKFGTVSSMVATKALPFSSKRKMSAVSLQGIGTIALGASEFMFETPFAEVKQLSEKYMKQGLRVLCVGHSKDEIVGEVLPKLQPVAILVLSDTIRSDSPEIIKWFRENDVQIKIISGDNPLSVSVIAKKVGVENADKYVSLDGKTDEEVASLANDYTVFGRVTPEQKAILIKALKQNGKKVAMTGDGVNDTLAMRESDCAISVACGSEAARSCAHLVLMDNKFSSMPSVVREGRQVVNNIQNSSSLYLMKTMMTILTTITVLFTVFDYPFEAQHLYAFEFFINGIPAFFLALRPNEKLITGNFLSNVWRKTLPNGIAVYFAVALTYIFAVPLGISQSPSLITSIAMVSMTLTGVVALVVLCFPMDKLNFAAASFAVVCTPLALFYLLPAITSIVATADSTPYLVALNATQGAFVLIAVTASTVVLFAAKYIIMLINKRRKIT